MTFLFDGMDATARARYWPEVERFFGQLPGALHQQGVILRHDLGTAFSDTGQFEDLLTRPYDLPLLDFHTWMTADWAVPAGPARDQLERGLFLALVFTFAAVVTRESRLDPDSTYDDRYADLEQALTHEAERYLLELFPDDSPFWSHYRALMDEHARALHTRAPAEALLTEAGLLDEAARLAYSKIPSLAVALWAGRAHAIPQLTALHDHVNAVVQIMHAITTVRRDVHQGRLTCLIARTLHAAGIPFDEPVAPERVLGALVLTGSVDQIARECRARLDHARDLAEGLGLPSFAAYAERLQQQMEALGALFSLNARPAGPSAAAPLRPVFAPYTDTLAQAIRMAEGYLLADPALHESWEVQRRGVFNVPELTSRAFPSGLVLEVLCRYHRDLGAQVDEVLQTYAKSGFRYYPHANVPPDADDLGLALRLWRYAAHPERFRAALTQALERMRANVTEAGEIPCWFIRSESDRPLGTAGGQPPTRLPAPRGAGGPGGQVTAGGQPEAFGPVVLWGNRCATVQANLLLGLRDYDTPEHQALSERATARWLDRWQAVGLGANTFYVAPYALWAAAKLLRAVAPVSGAADELLSQRLQHEAHTALTPQAAALLALACLPTTGHPSLAALFDPAWITLLLKHQHLDGGWMPEALFIAPTRGERAAWYASRLATTAFCYHALRAYKRT